MNHPLPEHDAAILHRMRRAEQAITDHPETYRTESLDEIRRRALALAQAAGRAFTDRTEP